MKGQVRNITNGAGSVIGTFRWAYLLTPLTASVINDIYYAYVRVAPKPVDVVWTGTHDGTISLPYNDNEIFPSPEPSFIDTHETGQTGGEFCTGVYRYGIYIYDDLYIAVTLVGSEPSNNVNLREV